MRNFREKILLLTLLWLGLTSFRATAQNADTYVRPYNEPFQFGTNFGYYGTNWNDESLAGIAQKLGAHSVRPTLPEYFVEGYGYNIRQSTFSNYVNQQGMREITCFIEKPSDAHRDWNTYPGASGPSKLFARLYDPIWNPDGTVNTNNYYANYVYKLLQVYGSQVRFWEVVNEPDYTYAYDKSQWLTRAPTPWEQVNTQAPFFHYIRMLRITYEIVKKYRPDAYVTTGGLGYPEYVDALLRYTDNPDNGQVTAQYPATGGAYFDVLSFHAYPAYALHYWDNSIGAMRYIRTSDYAANKVMEIKNTMTDVLNKYGYNGGAHPAKLLVLTESNVSRRNSDDRTGTDEMQRNYGIKALVLAQKNNIKQFYYYSLGEAVDAPAPGSFVSGSDEIGLMGLYENLNRATPAYQTPTQLGRAFATTSQLLYGYYYDAGRTAALNLPAGVDGAAFNKNGAYVYVLWAKALTDNSEYASASYSFPAGWNMGTVQRYEWDFASYGSKSTSSAQNIQLGGTPAFFVPDGSVATAPAPAPAPTPTPPATTACSATGTFLREQWSNVSGTSVSSIPTGAAPTTTSLLTQFEAPAGQGFNYGARLRGYICPPQSGNYTFNIVGDDETELWLSTNDNPANRVRIASCNGWTSGPRDWTRNAGQQSAPVTLTAGRRYYVEVLHKQGWGNDYVAVAWRLPDGTFEGPIPGSRLSPFGAGTPTTTAPAPAPAPTPPTTTTCSATGTFLREQWNNVTGNTVGSIPTATTPTSTSLLTSLETPAGQGNNYGARLRGYLCPPQTGAYTFATVGDDNTELWLSTDDNPANKVRIAYCWGWTSGPRDWTRNTGQQSAPVTLTAGRRYYVEVLHKQGWGNDYAAVAWRLPDGTFEGPIPGSRLSPFVTSSTAAVAKTTSALLGKPAATADEQSSSGALKTELLAFPNPFNQQATVQFSLATAGRATLSIFDVQGRLVRQLFSGSGAAGAVQRFTVNAQGLSQGVYVLRLTTDAKVLTQKLVLEK